ncbi:hypothetical protein [Candidatus Nitrotoga sp. 1052]|uniref:hypothetical protein n=1 Tax=Candidatus Nitrotoga sp. 1052 TaxID=2886964 RepID=UPI001EF46628|nr:hypothetical protein [Candidatus Nitrotoga sp. 1052]CAH1083195.1 hypothetical protein NTG1052_450026 [Candidatus Nitrotoga sp. 1052]
MHTLLDLRCNIPGFIHISDGKLGDVNILDVLVLEPGAIRHTPSLSPAPSRTPAFGASIRHPWIAARESSAIRP